MFQTQTAGLLSKSAVFALRTYASLMVGGLQGGHGKPDLPSTPRVLPHPFFPGGWGGGGHFVNPKFSLQVSVLSCGSSVL